jgi:hypothetical protein
MVLDSFIPCSPFGMPLFSRSHDQTPWVSLLEKYFAKRFYNYSNLSTGSCRSALFDLTDCPVVSINVRDYKGNEMGLFGIIQGYLEADCVVTCGSGVLDDEVISSQHAFVLNKIFICEDEMGIGILG